MTAYQGSPPRMRGKARLGALLAMGFGITPAYAGKSSVIRGDRAPGKDHPRVCGEKARPCPAPPPRRGSPPRMRGKGRNASRVGPGTRITPAYAGKSPEPYAQGKMVQDHPRVCGEKVEPLDDPSKKEGSPPRMRGKVCPPYRRVPPRRITPAHAGKSYAFLRFGAQSRDHPRACGEKVCHK